MHDQASDHSVRQATALQEHCSRPAPGAAPWPQREADTAGALRSWARLSPPGGALLALRLESAWGVQLCGQNGADTAGGGGP